MKRLLPLLAILLPAPAFAEGTRQLDAHEHGVGDLNIAVDGNTVSIELHAPGADIVGFEYEAQTDEDRAAIEAAVATLARPLDLFVLPDAAECTVTQASAELEADDEHGHDDHGHDDHAETHDEGNEPRHTEFHAEYTLTCADPGAITGMTFAYFDTFENARELNVQLATDAGAQAFEVAREDPSLNLQGMF